jgi:hypothetical protein
MGLDSARILLEILRQAKKSVEKLQNLGKLGIRFKSSKSSQFILTKKVTKVN